MASPMSLALWNASGWSFASAVRMVITSFARSCAWLGFDGETGLTGVVGGFSASRAIGTVCRSPSSSYPISYSAISKQMGAPFIWERCFSWVKEGQILPILGFDRAKHSNGIGIADHRRGAARFRGIGCGRVMDDQNMGLRFPCQLLGVADGPSHVARGVLIPVADTQVEGVKDNHHPFGSRISDEPFHIGHGALHIRPVREVKGSVVDEETAIVWRRGLEICVGPLTDAFAQVQQLNA